MSIVGARFGKLLVIGSAPVLSHKRRAVCVCDCGCCCVVRENSLKTGNTKSCGCVRRSRITGRRIHKGYVLLWCPDHPNSWGSGYVPEHVFVMSGMIERPLRKGEEVHHRNGDKSDNSPSNLELWDTRHPRGQRVSDKIKWASEFLRAHGYNVEKS
jgi:hypothetical protein